MLAIFQSNIPFQVLPPWNAKKSGNISFKFRTNEANGLILFNGGIRPPRVSCSVVLPIFSGRFYRSTYTSMHTSASRMIKTAPK